jgi:hypothetical protein
MIKGKLKKQVLQLNITKLNSKGEEETFTILGTFHGDIKYCLDNISTYLDETRWGGKLKLEIETDNIKVWGIN